MKSNFRSFNAELNCFEPNRAVLNQTKPKCFSSILELLVMDQFFLVWLGFDSAVRFGFLVFFFHPKLLQ